LKIKDITIKENVKKAFFGKEHKKPDLTSVLSKGLSKMQWFPFLTTIMVEFMLCKQKNF
jgi:hypothetical protein